MPAADCPLGHPSPEHRRADRAAIGLAHDFKNIVNAISGYAGFLIEDLASLPQQREMAERICNICTRANGLIAELLDTTAPAQPDSQPSNVGAAVAASLRWLEPLMMNDVALRLHVAEPPCWTQVARGQIDQVLLNLCVNARDAIGGRTGVVAVTCEPVGRDHPDRALFATGVRGADALATGGALAPAVDFVAVTVRDDGVGMNQALLDKAFEPLFSTKTDGWGTGLGLDIVRSVVLATDGAYAVTSRPGLGTRFAVYWPQVPPLRGR